MTISATITAKQYTGNGTTTQFAFANKIFAATDLVVTLIDLLGNQYAFVNFTNVATGLSYTVQGVDVDTGCTVVFSAPPTNGWTIDIRSLIPDLQGTSIKNQGSFFPELHEEAFDRATRMIQDLLRLAYIYGIHGPDLESVIWPALPIAAQRKNTALLFDGSGLPTVGQPVAQTLAISQVQFFGVDSGAANTYIVAVTSPAITFAQTLGVLVRFTALNPNTGPSTANIAGTGSAPIVGQTGLALTGGEVPSTGPTWVQWTGTAWQIVGTGAMPDRVRTAGEIAAGVIPTSYLYASGAPYYDIRRTGGTPGLVANNTTAFNNAVAALGANGGVIFFPIGDWRGDFRVNQNNVTLVGQGGVGETNTTCLRPFTTASYTAVTAGSFVIGTQYQIVSIGTTDFTAIGAGSNTVGLWFRCVVGAGTGTGTARPATSATLIFGDGSTTFRKCGIQNLNVSGDDGSGNQADMTLALHGQSNFSALRYELMGGIHTLHLEPRGGNPITGVMFSHCQHRNDNTPNTITGISKAASAVVTVSTVSVVNPFAVNMLLSFDGVAGMTQINQLVGLVTAIGGVSGAWTATVNINSSGFGAWTSGGTTNNASMRTVWARRNDNSVGGNYFTNVHMTNFHINGPPGSATAGGQGVYAIELDATNSNGMTLGLGFGYLDVKGCTTPAGTNACGSIFLRNGNESINPWYVNLDPGATGVVVVETLGSGQNPTRFWLGSFIADAQYFKNSASSILIPASSQFAADLPLLRDPFLVLSGGVTLTNVLDPYGNKAADVAAPLPLLNEDGPLGPITLSNADWSVKTVGKGLRVKEGSNAKQGVSAAMSGGSVTVSNTSITANSRIIVTRQDGGTNPGAHYVNSRSAGVSFTIVSTNAADTGTSAYQIFEPA